LDQRKITREVVSTNLFKFRFPFVAAEVLAGDNDRLLDFILHQGKLTIEEEEITEVEV
jgi:hypothetical protein